MSAADAHLLAQAAVGDDARAFALLAELSEALAVSLDLRRTLPTAIQRIVDYMQVEAASLFLYDEQAEELECKVCVGPVDVRGLRLTPDAAVDERVYRRIDEETGFVTRSLICLPLTAAKGTIGVLELINKLDGSPFDATDAGILRLLAVPTALAINNARLANALIEQQRLKREFDLARRLQKLMLPKRRSAGFPLLAVNVPAHEKSADF